MNTQIPFDNTYAGLGPDFYTAQSPEPVPAPRVIAWNDGLARQLGIVAGDDLADVFGGNAVPRGAAPLAQLYSGHQFGHYNPQLGDGRALLLGEVQTPQGRFDIQLKGSGPTPYSRSGDGRAWLGPVLREYVVSEAMHALGIPTTRALAAVSTGADIFREDGALPGAILTRVAASHIRVGTFQVFAHRGQTALLRAVTDYTMARHYPQAQGPMDLLRAVIAALAELIAAWMSVGFIHGVMNTDNCALSGETIDYGPCAFMDDYHPGRVFSSIDQMGRYAYANQPRIAVWNMAQFATALVQLYDDKDAAVAEATQAVRAMPAQIEAAWLRRFGAKLGLAAPGPDDGALIEGLMGLMQRGGSDFTNTFRALCSGSAEAEVADRAGYAAWHRLWRDRLAGEEDPEAIMRAANPVLIPRNHRIEAMIAAAVAGDMAPFQRMMTALANPFADDGDVDDLRRPPTPQEVVPATFCGT